MDGVRRAVGAADSYAVQSDGILRVYGHAVDGEWQVLAEWPIFHIREIRHDG